LKDGEGMAHTVYLLHFSSPLSHARHYLGFAQDLDARLADHASGNGARLMSVIREAGITWTLARTWPGGRSLERRLKRRKEAPALCPICAGDAALRRACNSNPAPEMERKAYEKRP
jgi:predicted GIY-YIG superfamily endonuclease